MFETTRLFVGNLPFGVFESDLREAFSPYGKIISAELKQKKDVYENEKTKAFAFVTLETSPSSVDQCIEEFSRNKWNGEKVSVSRARESFMERLKKEREDSQNKRPPFKTDTTEGNLHSAINERNEMPILPVKWNQEKIPSEQGAIRKSKRDLSNVEEILPTMKKPKVEDKIDIKDNNFMKNERDNSKLSISDAKRLNSIKEMRNTYNSKKSIIQQSLSNIDKNVNLKIKFESDDELDVIKTKKSKFKQNNDSKDFSKIVTKNSNNALFDDSNDDASDEDLNFDVRKQFEGNKGQKLLELQARYKSDKRFALDERFHERDGDKDSSPEDETQGVELAADDEKARNLNLLKDLGIDVSRPKHSVNEENSTKKRTNMFRFDPTRPEHEKFIHPNENQPKEQPKKSKKERRKEREQQISSQINNKSEIKEPESVQVSQETFYNVNVQFTKNSDENVLPFSLLNMFGNKNSEDNEEDYDPGENKDKLPSISFASTSLKKTRNPLDIDTKNPFKYDSSDSENETEDNKKPTEGSLKNMEDKSTLEGGPRLETFFFVKNDKRFKEGLEFFANTSNIQQKMRREMKEIVKKRLSNNERKNSKKLFKKKIGGKRQQFGKHTKPRKIK